MKIARRTANATSKTILRTFIVVLASVILLTAGLSVLLFAHSYREQMQRANENKLRQAADLFETLNDTAKNNLLRISLTQQYRDLIAEEISPEDLSRVLVELSNLYTGIGEHSPEAFFYILDFRHQRAFSLNTMQKSYPFDEFFDRELLSAANQWDKSDKFCPTLRCGVANLPPKAMTYVYFEGADLSYQQVAIVANYDAAWLSTKSAAFLSDTDDLLVAANGELAARTDRLGLSDRDLEQLLDGESANLSRRLLVNRFAKQGFAFWLLSDEQVQSQPLYRVYLMLALCAAALILIAVSVSLPLSRRIVRSLERKYQKPRPEGAVVRLLQKLGDTPVDAEVDLGAFGIPEETRRQKVCILLYHLDSDRRICSLYNESDLQVILFGIANVTEEMFSSLCTAKSFSLHGAVVTALYDFSKDIREPIRRTVREVQAYIHKHFSLTFTASVSSIGEFADIKEIFHDVKLFSDNAFYAPDGALLTGEDAPEEGKPLPPTVLLESLAPINSLDTDKIKDFLIESVFCPLRERKPPLARTKQLLANLIAQINDSLYNLSERSAVDLSAQIEAFAAIPRHSRKLSEYSLNFCEQLDRLKTVLAAMPQPALSSKNAQLIDRVEALVEQRYFDPNLTVNAIAAEINLSSMYLCKIFKAHKNVQLNTYLCEYRLERAAELLRDTDETTKTISERCGFINTNYFYTLFKKYKKMTAREYQEMHRARKTGG